MTDCFFESFDSLVSYVLEKCDDKEKRIIEEEVLYIRENGWEKYFVLLSNVIRKSEFSPMTIDRGSATFSAIIAKSVLDECKLRGDKSKLIPYKILNYVIFIVWIARGKMLRDGIGELQKIDVALEMSIRSLGLSMKQAILEDKVELVVISQEPISEEEFEVCRKNAFPCEVTEEENALLKKNLIIVIDANDRI